MEIAKITSSVSLYMPNVMTKPVGQISLRHITKTANSIPTPYLPIHSSKSYLIPRNIVNVGNGMAEDDFSSNT